MAEKVPVALENERSGLLWELFLSCSEIQAGCVRLV